MSENLSLKQTTVDIIKLTRQKETKHVTGVSSEVFVGFLVFFSKFSTPTIFFAGSEEISSVQSYISVIQKWPPRKSVIFRAESALFRIYQICRSTAAKPAVKPNRQKRHPPSESKLRLL